MDVLLPPLQADMWKKCLECIDELLDILFENSNIFIGENIAEDSENLAISESQVPITAVCSTDLLHDVANQSC